MTSYSCGTTSDKVRLVAANYAIIVWRNDFGVYIRYQSVIFNTRRGICNIVRIDEWGRGGRRATTTWLPKTRHATERRLAKRQPMSLDNPTRLPWTSIL